MKTIAFAVALLAASPALADHDTDRRMWVERWRRCANSYVEAYPGHCADVVARAERKRQARDNGGHFRHQPNYDWLADGLRRRREHDRFSAETRRQWCWNNPAYCADGEPRSYGRR